MLSCFHRPLLKSLRIAGALLLLSGLGWGRAGAQEAVVERARGDLAAGRGWRAAQDLREGLPGEWEHRPDLLLLLAEAEANWGNWIGVRSLLEGAAAREAPLEARGWFLLGRAREEEESWAGADSAYTLALSVGGGGLEEEGQALEARIRSARARERQPEGRRVGEALDSLLSHDSPPAEWLALELARDAAARGETEATLSLLSRVSREAVRLLGWDLPARSLLIQGDSSAAEAAYWSALPSLSSADRGRGWERIAALRLARGDSVGARDAFHRVLETVPGGVEGLRAARGLLVLGFDSATVALAAAEALAGAGANRDALQAFDAHESLLGGPVPPSVGLGRARALLAVEDRREAMEILVPLAASEVEGVAAPALALEAAALRGSGRGADALRVQDELVERFPGRSEAVEVLFSRASALEGGGDRAGALAGYRATIELSPAQNLAGEARMREGQILLALGRTAEAARAYQSYLDAFPEGRRWDQAAFWAGRTLLAEEKGRDEGRAILLELLRRFPLSYYAVEAGRLLGTPYAPEIPRSESLPVLPDELAAHLALVDDLRRAGLEEGAAWELSRLTQRIRELPEGERQDALLAFALELNERGLTREGINLGWELRRLGRSWDTHLLSAIYPFPYRTVILAEARERGLDPFLVAGLIRQESAFWARARSRADARGLMQVLPSTGAELARSVGPRGFQADAHLYRPEINVRLGVAFLSDLIRRFGTDLPILLSAYNAGPTRALRWREYPEAEDLPRFTERIPFEETRGYVKAVTLNRAIYTWLYRELSPSEVQR